MEEIDGELLLFPDIEKGFEAGGLGDDDEDFETCFRERGNGMGLS